MARFDSIRQISPLFLTRARVRSLVGYFLAALIVFSNLLSHPVSAAPLSETQTMSELKGADRRKKFQAIQKLRSSGTSESGDALAALLAAEKDPHALLAAMDSLASRGEPFRAAAVGPLLKHPVVAVRQRAAQTLGMLTGPAAEKFLMQALRSEKDPSVRTALTQGLSLCGSAQSVDDLQQALSDKSPAVRANARAALSRIPGKEAENALRHTNDKGAR